MIAFRHLIIWTAFMLATTGCSDQTFDSEPTSASISFGIDLSGQQAEAPKRSLHKVVTPMVATSADADTLRISMTEMPTTEPPTSRGFELDRNSLTNFGVTCLRTISGSKTVYFHAEKYQGSVVSDTWTNTDGRVYYWMPEDARFDFFAWSPNDVPAFTDVISSSFTYTVPSDVKSQPDLCGCYVENATPGQKVALRFGHLLSKVVFRVPERDNLASGTITNIEISNIYRSGSYSFTSGEWTLAGSDLFTFKIKPETDYVSGGDLSANGLQLFMLPQTIAKGSIITITFKGDNGITKTFTMPLEGINWRKGLTYTFNIGIADDGTFEFVNDTPTLDANYVMHTNIIRPKSIGESQQWTARVRTSDNADVSIIRESDVNSLALDGFWTDRILSNTGVDKGSARGSAELSSTGPAEVAVRFFLPENVMESNRIIYVDFYVDNSTTPVTTLTLMQYCPDWVGNYGWEQLDDNGTGNFGFDWTRDVYLTYKYGMPRIGFEYSTQYRYISSIRAGYGNPDWTSLGHFNRDWKSDRGYIRLEYFKLTNLTGCDSRTDGFANTAWLNQYGGDAATMAMEHGILSIRKTELGHTNETAFRIATKEDDGNDAPVSTLTSPKLSSDIALSHALMKNAYNIMETNVGEGGEVGYIPKIVEIKWYLPAVDQFSVLPRLEPINPSEYWSSTVTPGSDTEPFDGGGSQRPRSTWLKIRACRDRSLP